MRRSFQQPSPVKQKIIWFVYGMITGLFFWAWFIVYGIYLLGDIIRFFFQ